MAAVELPNEGPTQVGYFLSWDRNVYALRLREVQRDALMAFFARYGFKTWRRELEIAGAPNAANAETVQHDSVAAPPAQTAEKHYETVLSLAALDDWLAKVGAAELTAIDTETDSLDAMSARIVGISLAVTPFAAAYVPLRHSYAGAPDQLPIDAVLARLKPWLEDPNARKLGQNIKYDTHVFANAGITVRGYLHDTLLESYVLEAHKPHSLESLALRHLGRRGLSYEDVCGKGVHQIPFAQVDVAKASDYSCEDSEMTLQVHQTLWPQLQVHAGMADVYRRIEVPAAAVLGRIERHGVLIDSQLLARQSQELAARMVALEAQAHALAGQPFNLGSPKQIGEILFGKLGLPVRRKTASGVPSRCGVMGVDHERPSSVERAT